MNIEEISRKLAQKWTEDIDLDDLMSFFYNSQIEYLADLPDVEVLNLAMDADIITAISKDDTPTTELENQYGITWN